MNPALTPDGAVMGIDPGLYGALAVLSTDGRRLTVWDMPLIPLALPDDQPAKPAGRPARKRPKSYRTQRRRIDLRALASLVSHYASVTRLAVIEDPRSRPGEGHVGAFSFGFTCGATRMATIARGIPTIATPPATWKLAMGVPADKDKAREMAMAKFPAYADLFTRKRDDGRAEAALLALYARQLDAARRY